MSVSRTVVVAGYDGSAPATRAVEWAAIHASARGVPMTVMYVVDERMDVIDSRLRHAHLEAAAADVVSEGVEKAAKAAPGIEVAGVVRIGRAAATLVEASGEAAVMVLGARGRGPVLGALLGSVTAAVSAHASCPVIVLPDSPAPPLDQDHPVLVGIDGSAASPSVIRFGVGIAAVMDVPLTLMATYLTDVADPELRSRLLTLESHGGPVFTTAARESAVDAVTRGAALASLLEPRVDVRAVVVEGPAMPTLAATAAEHGLLVLARRGGGGFEGLQVGSVTSGLLHRAPCPIAVVPPSGDDHLMEPDPPTPEAGR